MSPQYGIGGKFVFCYNENKDEFIFPSINAARQHFKVRWTFIKKITDTGNYVDLNGIKYIIQSVPSNFRNKKNQYISPFQSFYMLESHTKLKYFISGYW